MSEPSSSCSEYSFEADLGLTPGLCNWADGTHVEIEIIRSLHVWCPRMNSYHSYGLYDARLLVVRNVYECLSLFPGENCTEVCANRGLVSTRESCIETSFRITTIGPVKVTKRSWNNKKLNVILCICALYKVSTCTIKLYFLGTLILKRYVHR